jgi:hypothetical protein
MSDSFADQFGRRAGSPPAYLTTPHVSPSLQSALDASLYPPPPVLALPESVQPTTSTTIEKSPPPPPSYEGEETTTTATATATDTPPIVTTEQTHQLTVAPLEEFPPPPPLRADSAEHPDVADEQQHAPDGQYAERPDDALPATIAEGGTTTPSDDREQTAAGTTAAPISRALITDVIPIPRYDLTRRAEWTQLEKQVFTQIRGTHARATDPHTAHKSRTAFAAAGQMLGLADIRERLADTASMRSLTDQTELLLVARLPETNIDRLAFNHTPNWIKAVDDATRTVLGYYMRQPTAESTSAHATRSTATILQVATSAMTPKKSSAGTRAHTSPPTARATTNRQKQAPQWSKLMVSMDQFDSSDSTPSEDSRSTSPHGRLSGCPKSTATQSAIEPVETRLAAVSTTESERSSTSEAEQPPMEGRTKETTLASSKSAPPKSRKASPAPSVPASRKELAATTTLPVPPALRLQVRTHEAVHAIITTIGKGCASMEIGNINAMLHRIASILQQVVDESNHCKAELESAVRLNTALATRVVKLEQQSIAHASAMAASLTPQQATPPATYAIEPVKGDGHCFFTGIETGQQWSRGDAKKRIIQFLFAENGPTDEEMSILYQAKGPQKGGVDITRIKGAYITELLADGYHGGEVEAKLLVREQGGRLRIVILYTTGPADGKPTPTHGSYQVDDIKPKEEVILYHTKHSGKADHPQPDHYDLVVERMQDGTSRRKWQLTETEASATTDSKLPRWTQARLACVGWNRQRSPHGPTQPSKSAPDAKSKQGAAPITQSAAGMVKAWAGSDQPAASTITASRGSGQTSAPFQTASGHKQKSRGNAPATPQLVILNIRPDVTEAQLRHDATENSFDISSVAEIEFRPNGTRGESKRAVLHMQTAAQAKNILKQYVALGLSKAIGWEMQLYQPPAMRGGPRAPSQDVQRAEKHLVAPSTAFIGFCDKGGTKAECSRGDACRYIHTPGYRSTRGGTTHQAARGAARGE